MQCSGRQRATGLYAWACLDVWRAAGTDMGAGGYQRMGRWIVHMYVLYIRRWRHQANSVAVLLMADSRDVRWG